MAEDIKKELEQQEGVIPDDAAENAAGGAEKENPYKKYQNWREEPRNGVHNPGNNGRF